MLAAVAAQVVRFVLGTLRPVTTLRPTGARPTLSVAGFVPGLYVLPLKEGRRDGPCVGSGVGRQVGRYRRGHNTRNRASCKEF